MTVCSAYQAGIGNADTQSHQAYKQHHDSGVSCVLVAEGGLHGFNI